MDRDHENRWLLAAGLVLAFAIGAFGLWLWSLILTGPAR